jgi:predicted lysophospholipase L1 biosynthesis ABC-type transport system permease subunit
VVVVNDALARQEWGSAESAIGQRIRDFLPGTDWHEVVGVTGSIRYGGLSQPAPGTVYWPNAVEKLWEQDLMVFRSLEYVIRVRGNPSAFVGPLREAVWSVNRSLPLANIRTLDRLVDESMARTAFAMVMLSIAAVVALVLGLVGIYGVISYIVAQRTREIGVRIALGARPAQVRRMVVGQAAIVAAIGVGVGLVGAGALTRLMAGLLYGTSPLDLPTYGIVTVAIGLVALAASWLPARRAARVDPVAALRAE